VGSVIEVTAALQGAISETLSLTLGTDEMLLFSTWLIALTNIFHSNNTGDIPNFFKAEASFDGSFEANVELSEPFDFLGSASASGQFVEPFVIDFLHGNVMYPKVDFDVQIKGIGDVQKPSFSASGGSLERCLGVPRQVR